MKGSTGEGALPAAAVEAFAAVRRDGRYAEAVIDVRRRPVLVEVLTLWRRVALRADRRDQLPLAGAVGWVVVAAALAAYSSDGGPAAFYGASAAQRNPRLLRPESGAVIMRTATR